MAGCVSPWWPRHLHLGCSPGEPPPGPAECPPRGPGAWVTRGQGERPTSPQRPPSATWPQSPGESPARIGHADREARGAGALRKRGPCGHGAPRERPAAGRRRSASPVLPARSKPWPCFHRRGELRVDHVQNASCTVWRAVTISSERENGKPKIRKLPPAALRFRVTTEWTFVLGGGGSTQGGPGQRQEAPPGPGPHSHFPFCPSRGRLVRELGGNWRAEVAALGPGHTARSRAMHPPRAGV